MGTIESRGDRLYASVGPWVRGALSAAAEGFHHVSTYGCLLDSRLPIACLGLRILARGVLAVRIE